MNRSGLTEILPDLLKDKVYVGLSAGSMVLGREIGLRLSQVLYEEDLDRTTEMNGLGYFDLYFLPHLNSPYFSKMTESAVKEATEDMAEKIYVMDDNSALRIVDDKREIISEGSYTEIN
jgi:dipeptidase E